MKSIYFDDKLVVIMFLSTRGSDEIVASRIVILLGSGILTRIKENSPRTTIPPRSKMLTRITENGPADDNDFLGSSMLIGIRKNGHTLSSGGAFQHQAQTLQTS